MSIGIATPVMDANTVNGLGNIDNTNPVTSVTDDTDYYGATNSSQTMDEEYVSQDTTDVNQEQSLNTEPTEDTGSTPQSEDEQSPTVDDYESAWDNIDVNSVDPSELSTDPLGSDDSDDSSDDSSSDDNSSNDSDNSQETHDNTYSRKNKWKLKYKGREIEINSEEEAIALMQKGLDYEFKMTRIKPYRKAIDIIEKYNLTPDDLELFARAKSGDSDAISKLVSDDYIESSDMEYDTTANVDSISSENKNDELFKKLLQTDPELAGRAIKVYNEIDPTFKAELTQKGLLEAFVGSVATGEFDKVYPHAIKIKALNPALDWINAYQQAIIALNQNKEITTEPKEPKRVQRQKKTNVRSAIKQSNDYDSVWDSDIPLEQLEKQIFGG